MNWGLLKFDLGPFKTVAALVVLCFMHVRSESKVKWIFVTAGLVWFLIMVDLTLSDCLTRENASETHRIWRQPVQTPPGSSVNDVG
ncbi:MAG TPA: hypothetical protein VK327_06530 [Candidatus Paceibacterota bacterium]|nr:hypothetical protein [Candidatus Paceibacterota bacterium]